MATMATEITNIEYTEEGIGKIKDKAYKIPKYPIMAMATRNIANLGTMATEITSIEYTEKGGIIRGKGMIGILGMDIGSNMMEESRSKEGQTIIKGNIHRHLSNSRISSSRLRNSSTSTPT